MMEIMLIIWLHNAKHKSAFIYLLSSISDDILNFDNFKQKAKKISTKFDPQS